MTETRSNFIFHAGKDQMDTHSLFKITNSPQSLVLDEASLTRANFFRDIVNKKVKSGDRVYGINTGFGFLAEVPISADELNKLQVNLLRSHACGVGKPLSKKAVRALLILRIHSFLLGHSGIRPQTVERLQLFLREDVLPVIPRKGSVGASGDLAPLAHLALPLIGEGEVYFKGERTSAQAAHKALGISPLELAPKEGLSLINGTHFTCARAAFALHEARFLLEAADICLALSLDAIRGTLKPFDARIHHARGQQGQKFVAEHILSLFDEDDEIMQSHADCNRVQDPYSFRCSSQVHGASLDAFLHAETIVNRELNSVTDNPLVFDNQDVLSGGNFHAQPLAIVMDFLSIAIAELGSISEQRTMKLTNPTMSGLPAFLTKNSGLESGFMIPHVVAASLVSENKTLCFPASVDSIPTSADKEDHVSMGPNAVQKCSQIIENTAHILAIEILAACQGLSLLAPLKPAKKLQKIYQAVRKISPEMLEDRSISRDIEELAKFILTGGLHQLLNQPDDGDSHETTSSYDELKRSKRKS